MRKTISVLLIVLVGLMMFTACNPESSISDALVKVRLVDGNSRALSASLNFDVNKVKRWEYSAIKADNGLKTGETKGTNGVVTTAVLDGNKQTAALSQGAWNFYLYGYDATENGNLICKGSALDVLITSESNSVSITVNPLQEDKGVIAIDDNIVIVDKKGVAYDKGEGDDEYTKTITVTKFSDSSVVTADATSSISGYTTYSVNSGTYKVVVTYTATHNSTTYTAATATKYVNVYDHLTTKVSGTITESEQAATITAEGNFEAEKTIEATFTKAEGEDVSKNTEATTVTFDFTPAGAKDDKVEEKKDLVSTFSFPAGSLKKTSDDATVSIEYKTASAGTAAKTYEITDATGAVVAVVDITANGFDRKDLKGNDGNYPVLTTYIGKGIADSFDSTENATLRIQYFGNFEESDDDKAELLSYNSETGYLTYRVKHFSTYLIISDKYVATDDNGGMYETLADAAENATEGATITLWKDVDFSVIGGSEQVAFTKSGSLVLGANTVLGSIEIGKIYEQDPKTVMIIDGSAPEGKYNIKASLKIDGGLIQPWAINVFKPSTTINGGRYTADNVVVSVLCQGVYTSEGEYIKYGDNRIPYCNELATTLTINDGVFDATGVGTCIYHQIGKTVINGGTFTAEGTNGGDVIYIESGDSKQSAYVIVNGGTFAANGDAVIIRNEEQTAATYPKFLTINGGTFTGTLLEGKGDDLTIEIKGGTFSSDPSDYVASGYTATKDEQSGTWTVSKNS